MKKSWLVKLISALGVVWAIAAPEIWSQSAPAPDNWATGEECLKANSALYYYPTIVSKRPLAATEKIRGHPTGGCFEMDLPDRSMKRGFVRIEAGRPFVYDKNTNKLLRLAQCNNDVYSFVAFGSEPVVAKVTAPVVPPEKVAGPAGPPGATGAQGPPGTPGVTGAPGPVATPVALAVATATSAPKEVPKDYVVRSRGGHGKLYAIAGAAIVGTAGWLIWRNNHGGGNNAKGKGPGLATDSVKVKCIATSYPNNCPVPNRIGGSVLFRP